MPNDLESAQQVHARTNGRSERSSGRSDRPTGQPDDPFAPPNPMQPLFAKVARYWWVPLLSGVLWMVISIVVLKFNHASVVTVGILTGLMFLLFAAEEFVIAALDVTMRWFWIISGVLMTAAGIVALVHPVSTFAGFADILGFVFLIIAVTWMVRAFIERPVNQLWWLGLISGILMVGMAFWVSGQFYLTRAATLLVFAGIWAAMKGVTDIVRAFEMRRLGS